MLHLTKKKIQSAESEYKVDVAGGDVIVRSTTAVGRESNEAGLGLPTNY